MRSDDTAWVRAGGDADRLALYRTIGDVAVFSDGEDRCLAAVHPALPDVGTVGDWVGGDAVRVAAEAWLAARGVATLRAPMELCTWFPYRVTLGPHDDAPFLFEVTERPERWRAAGYAVAATYASALLPHDGLVARGGGLGARLRARGWRVETLRTDRDGRVSEDVFREAVGQVHRVATAAFGDAYGFAPIPLAALQAWYAPYRERLDPRLVLFARAPSGEIAAFVFGVPDLRVPERRWFLIKTACTHPRYHGLGVGTWLVAKAHRAARDLGYVAGVHALMWEASPSNRWSRYGGRVFRRYALLEKPVGSPSSEAG